jgi:cobalamin biosynthesis protein CobD/CbiB
MGMGKYNHSKFVFSETFNNRDGKTSGSGFAGIILTLTGAACFVAAMVGWYLQKPDVIEIMGKIIIVLTLASALLGVRKFMGGKDNVDIGGDSEGKRVDQSVDQPESHPEKAQ